MVPASFHEFFSGCATIAGALIGLLFVAVSVAPGKLTGRSVEADYQVKAGAAFSALVNTLVIALVALLPGASFSTTILILAAAGVSTTAGLVIVLWREHRERIRPGAVIMLVALLLLYGLQLANGVELRGSPHSLNLIGNQGGLIIGFFVFAIARAWELVGARDTGLLSTVAGITRRPADEPDTAAPGSPGSPGNPGNPGTRAGPRPPANRTDTPGPARDGRSGTAVQGRPFRDGRRVRNRDAPASTATPRTRRSGRPHGAG